MIEVGSDVKFFIEHHPRSLHEFGDSRPEALRKLLSPETCEVLEQHKWGICLATIELDEATAKVVTEINDRNRNLPVVMWTILKEEEGYWTDEFNVKQTKQRVGEIERWVNKYNLHVDGVGLDIEPSIQFVRQEHQGVLRLGMAILERNKKLERMEKAGESPTQELADLIGDLKHRNIPTEAYILPQPFRDILGMFSPQETDHVYSMIYTSYCPDFLAGIMLNRLKPGEKPIFGNVSSTGKNYYLEFGGPPPSFIGREKYQRDVDIIRKKGLKEGGDYLDSFRVFSLTGKEVVNWTDEALVDIKRDRHVTPIRRTRDDR